MHTAKLQMPSVEEAVLILDGCEAELVRAREGMKRLTEFPGCEAWAGYYRYLSEQELLARTLVRDVARSLVEASHD